MTGPEDDERWLVVDGRRWRRTDPSLPADVVAALTSQLGAARSAVRRDREDPDALASARARVQLAKTGLGERGPKWWERSEHERRQQAEDTLRKLEELDPPVAE